MRALETALQQKGFQRIVGLDEAGRGPLAGPVVAAAVQIIPESFKAEIDDSKQLSPKKRALAYEEILGTCVVGIGLAKAAEIDRLNILEATFLAMRRALDRLPFQPDFCLVDGPLILPDLSIRQKAVIGGDRQCLCIAAASIVAKVTRDRIMERYDGLYPVYGFCRNKGYPTQAHREALRLHGSCALHRLTFRGVVE